MLIEVCGLAKFTGGSAALLVRKLCSRALRLAARKLELQMTRTQSSRRHIAIYTAHHRNLVITLLRPLQMNNFKCFIQSVLFLTRQCVYRKIETQGLGSIHSVLGVKLKRG